MHECASPFTRTDLVLLALGVARRAWSRGERSLHAIVGDEEEGGTWGGADDRAADATVDAAEAAGGEEAF